MRRAVAFSAVHRHVGDVQKLLDQGPAGLRVDVVQVRPGGSDACGNRGQVSAESVAAINWAPGLLSTLQKNPPVTLPG